MGVRNLNIFLSILIAIVLYASVDREFVLAAPTSPKNSNTQNSGATEAAHSNNNLKTPVQESSGANTVAVDTGKHGRSKSMRMNRASAAPAQLTSSAPSALPHDIVSSSGPDRTAEASLKKAVTPRKIAVPENPSHTTNIQQSTSSPSTTGAKSGQQKMSILSKISGPIAQALAPTVIDVGAENKRDRIKSIEHEQRNKRLSSGPLTRLTKITPTQQSSTPTTETEPAPAFSEQFPQSTEIAPTQKSSAPTAETEPALASSNKFLRLTEIAPGKTSSTPTTELQPIDTSSDQFLPLTGNTPVRSKLISPKKKIQLNQIQLSPETILENQHAQQDNKKGKEPRRSH